MPVTAKRRMRCAVLKHAPAILSGGARSIGVWGMASAVPRSLVGGGACGCVATSVQAFWVSSFLEGSQGRLTLLGEGATWLVESHARMVDVPYLSMRCRVVTTAGWIVVFAVVEEGEPGSLSSLSSLSRGPR